MSEWQALGAGFAFYLILEGLLPFFSPMGFKQMMATVLQLSDDQLRKFGAGMMIVGVALLFLIK